MKDNDFKRKDPIKKRLFQNTWAPKNIDKYTRSIEQNDLESIPMSFGQKFKNFITDFSALSSALGFILFGFGIGAFWGIYITAEQYPLKLEMARESQREGEIRNGELQALNNSLEDENEEFKTRITELEEKVSENEQVSLDTAISDNLRLPVETNIEPDSTMVFFDNLNVSVVHIGTSPEGYGATLSVSSSGLETLTKKELQVGEKVLYEVNNMRYEVLITDMDILRAKIQVIELPVQKK